MLDGVYLTLVFASNDKAVISLAAEIGEISAANKLNFSMFFCQNSLTITRVLFTIHTRARKLDEEAYIIIM